MMGGKGERVRGGTKEEKVRERQEDKFNLSEHILAGFQLADGVRRGYRWGLGSVLKTSISKSVELILSWTVVVS